MEADLKVLSSNFRYAQLGKIEALLKEVKRKVEADDPLKSWDYLPIFEFKFKKFGIFQTDQGQTETERATATEGNLQPSSPAPSDTLVIDNEDNAHQYSDSEQEEDLDLQYMQTDYENNQIVGDICTMYICKRRHATEMCHNPVHS